MMLEHEYALLGGFNRAHLGRWLGGLSALVSSALVFMILSVVDLAKSIGVNTNVPPMALSLVGAGAVYGVLYLLFNHVVWKFAPLGRLLKVPDLSGVWLCEGLRLETGSPEPWQGTVTIVQTWDKLRIHLETPTSGSDSVAAALLHDAATGYRLMYHYKNQPRLSAPELSAHHGFAELTFLADGRTATGEYFNGRGRNSFGTMTLRRGDA
jgi:hypothetical protein